MGRRRVGELMHVDHRTGEITKHTSLWSNKYTESFIMLRMTEGLDWMFDLGENEIKLALLLHHWSEPTNHRISLAGWQREYVCNVLKVKKRSVSLILRRLVELNCIKRISQNDFMVNPAHAFKCSASVVRERIEIYNNLGL